MSTWKYYFNKGKYNHCIIITFSELMDKVEVSQNRLENLEGALAVVEKEVAAMRQR